MGAIFEFDSLFLLIDCSSSFLIPPSPLLLPKKPPNNTLLDPPLLAFSFFGTDSLGLEASFDSVEMALVAVFVVTRLPSPKKLKALADPFTVEDVLFDRSFIEEDDFEGDVLDPPTPNKLNVGDVFTGLDFSEDTSDVPMPKSEIAGDLAASDGCFGAGAFFSADNFCLGDFLDDATLGICLGGAPIPIADSVGERLGGETVDADLFFVVEKNALFALGKILTVDERFGYCNVGLIKGADETDLLVSGKFPNKFSVGDRLGGGSIFDREASFPLRLAFDDDG